MRTYLLLFFTVSFAEAQPIVKNPSFESPGVDGCPHFQYKPAGAGWEFITGYAGISATGCKVGFVSPPAPEATGSQAAFLQSLGELAAIRQTVTGFVPGRTYVISFQAAGRRPNPADCNQGCGKLNFSVFVGSDKVLDVEPSNASFQQFTTRSFAANQPAQIISFSGTAPPRTDQSSFIDLVSISEVSGSPEVIPTAPATVSAAASISPPLQPAPSHLLECEAPGRCDGFWNFTGPKGVAVWQSGARAKLSVVTFDSHNIVIERSDSEGASPGLTAIYRGALNGKRFEGDVAWTWPGHWNGASHGHWSATIDDSPQLTTSLPIFLKDAAFKYDFNGQWRLTFPPESPRKPPMTVLVRQDPNGAIQFFGFNPNIFWPFGQCVINALYKNGVISGDAIEMPGRKGDGFGGWNWVPIEIKVIDANKLVMPGNIAMNRASSPAGANAICNPQIDVRAGHAREQLSYGNREYDLGNLGNAACWYYVSAVQGNEEAQAHLGLALFRGEGVSEDQAQAFYWFKKSAEQGNIPALRLISRFYESGVVVPKDPVLAKAWKDRAETLLADQRQSDDAARKTQANIEAWSFFLGGGKSDFQQKVEDNESRRMSHSDAVDSARRSQDEANFWTSATHYEAPAPPKKQP